MDLWITYHRLRELLDATDRLEELLNRLELKPAPPTLPRLISEAAERFRIATRDGTTSFYLAGMELLDEIDAWGRR